LSPFDQGASAPFFANLQIRVELRAELFPFNPKNPKNPVSASAWKESIGPQTFDYVDCKLRPCDHPIQNGIPGIFEIERD
jgi:hypothetical protein